MDSMDYKLERKRGLEAFGCCLQAQLDATPASGATPQADAAAEGLV